MFVKVFQSQNHRFCKYSYEEFLFKNKFLLKKINVFLLPQIYKRELIKYYFYELSMFLRTIWEGLAVNQSVTFEGYFLRDSRRFLEPVLKDFSPLILGFNL